MTGCKFEWSQEKNEWQNKGSVYGVPQSAQQQQSKSTAATVAAANKDPTKKAWFDINDDKNTNVYVSGLPFDITDEEFEQLMSKYGIIMKDPITHKLKVKLYRDENNEVKGDGRCCYLMVVDFNSHV
jgi:RNA recognition motif-containing protein